MNKHSFLTEINHRLSFAVIRLAVLAALCLAQGALADDAATIAAYIKSTTSNDLNATASGNSVTVTGNVSATPSSTNYLTLNIDAGVTVTWQATLAGTPNSDYALVNINGGSGTFNMSSGSITNTGTGRAITNNSTCVINVSGSARISSKSNGTIYLANSGTATAARLVISGGTVENTSTSSSSHAIYNYSTGAINVSGGTISAAGGYSIYNSNTSYNSPINAVNISITTLNNIYNSGGVVTVSSGTVNYIENNSTANISGGTIGGATRTSRAIYNYGTVNISGNARIISANTDSYGTIYHSSGTLNITGGTVENTATTGTNGNAIYNYWNSGTINISGGTVNSANGHAINSSNGSSTINISNGTVSTSGSGKSALYNDFSGTVKITGGTVSAASNGYAVNNAGSVTLILGNSPVITGRIYSYPEKLSVITSAPDIFSPGSRIYTLDFPADQYVVAKVAVMNGRDFLNNFELHNKDRALIVAGGHLAIATAVKVIFSPNGGSPNTWDTVSVVQGQTIPAAKNPLSRLANGYFSRTNYINGNKWSTNTTSGIPEFIFEDGSTPGTPVNNPTTLYLKWIPIFTITFNANGGSVNPASGTTKADSTLSLTSLPTPTRTGYTFNGWFTAMTGGTQISTTTGKYSANATYYARWTPITYTINYTLNSGAFPGGSDPNPASYTYESNTITFQNPSRDGYFFDGWYSSSSFAGTPVASIPTGSTTGNKTYYAKWSPVYTVTFDANGGSVSPASATTSSGSKLESLPTPTRSGYYFKGWFTAATGGTQIALSRVYTGNITIYAQWTQNSYTVSFNLNGGSGTTPASITGLFYGSTLSEEQKPSAAGVTRSGYSNDGKWYTRTGTSPDFTYTEFVFGTGGTEVEANTVLYLNWLPIATVSFVNVGGTVFNEGFEGTNSFNVVNSPEVMDSIFINETFEGTNSFTIVNGSGNRWYVGTDTKYDGTRAAYIATSSGTTNSYSISTNSVVHMYRNVTFPASSDPFFLTFYWKGIGESGYDDLKVYLVETSVTPTAGTVVSGTALGTYQGSNSWQQATLSIPASNAGTTKRLVFTWCNDYTEGIQPPIAIDNINIAKTSSSPTNNRWYVGTDTKYDGTRAAYIATSSGTANSYSITAPSTVHIYRDITFPASGGSYALNPYTLSFNWKGMGEASYDYLSVHLVETSVTPVAGTVTSGTTLGTYRGYDSWQQATVNIPASNAGTTKRLVFTWRNNASGGTNPPIAVDDITLTWGTVPVAVVNAVTGSTLNASQIPPAREFTRNGYVNDGKWYMDAAGTTEFVPGATTVTGNTTLYLKWIPVYTHTVNFNLSNGSGTVPSPVYVASDNTIFSEDFENANSFTVVNGSANKWHIGTDTKYGGSNSAYIAASGGTTNSYNVNSASIVHLYRDVTLPAFLEPCTLSFYWKGAGEVDYDYLSVHLVETSTSISSGTAVTSGLLGTYRGNTNWQLATIIIPTSNNGTTKRLVFTWRNDNEQGNQPPIALDNIVLKEAGYGSGMATTTPPPTESFAKTGYYTESKWYTRTGTEEDGYEYNEFVFGENGTPVRDDLTLYLKWLPRYKVSFDLNGNDVHIFSEDFEGTNSFTLVNGSQANKWAFGTATANGGSESAYISNDDGTSNAYTTTSSSTVHMYRSVTFPVSSQAYTLTFDWKGGYNSSYAYLRVSLIEVSSSITAGSMPSGTSLGTFYGYSTWQQASVSIPASNSGTTKQLVFTWYNANSNGTQPPIAVDNIVLKGIPAPIYITPPGGTISVAQKPSTNFTRTGYFLHDDDQDKWYTHTGTEESSYAYNEFVFGEDGTPVTNDVTLYLMWTPQYKVSFDLNGGSGTVPDNIYIMPPGSDSLTVAQKPSTGGFARIGYFLHEDDQGKWYTRTGTEEDNYVYTEFVFGENGTPITGNVTLYLKWTLLNYRVSFDSDGGSGRTNYTVFSEDFEGSTHLFTSANGSQTNKWAVGTATANGGSKSAYISNDGGTSNNYRTSSVSVTHIYHTVTFPVSSQPYTISFDWKGIGESGYDDLKVYLVETSSPITAGSVPSGTLLGTFGGSDSWQQASISIPVSNSGTTKQLVFTWRNNGESGVQPPIAVDNILLTATGVTVPSPSIATDVLPGHTLTVAQKPSAEGITQTSYVNDGKWYTVSGIEYTEFAFGEGGTPITDNVTLYLKWVIKTYMVTFVDRDGTQLSQQTVEHGSAATAPAEPTHTGYTFISWDKSFDEVTGNLTVTAVYETNAYTITYDLNNGTVSPTNLVSYTVETPSFTLRNPTRTGYTFAGWTGTNGTTPQTSVSVSLGSTGDRNYVANWTLNTYTVTFNANGGTVSPEFGTTGEGWTLTELPTPTRTGYTFSGWYTAATGGTPVTESRVYSANATIYAQWILINTYTVTFNANGGTVTPWYGTTGAGGMLDSLPTPSRTGYTFNNWYTTTTSSVVRNVTVVMRDSYGDGWDGGGALRISVNGSNLANNARLSSGNSGTYTFNVNSGDVVNFYWVVGSNQNENAFAVYYTDNPPSPAFNPASGASNSAAILFSRQYNSLSSVAGGTLLGSFTVPGGTNTEATVTENKVYSANTTIYARWTLNTYTITYDLDGGTVSSTNRVSYTAETPAFTLNNPTKAGYTFAGWTGTNGTTPQTAVSVSLGSTGDRNYVANWALNTYTVTFNANSGTVSPTSGTTGEGWKLSSLPTPTRTGYTFNGWYMAVTSGTAVTTSTVFSANTTIYAQWTLITYTVTFDANDGEVTLESGTTGEGWKLAELPTPTRTSYTFNGWYTAETGGMQITVNTAFSTDATIYAQWKLNTYTVTFKDHDGKTLKTETVEHGSAASAPTHHAREGHTFTSWDKEFDNVTSNLTVTAEYAINTYTITFKNHDGTELKTQTVEHGSAATAPTHHAKEGHTFTSWDKAFSNVISDLTVTAEYDINTYTVTFKDYDGKTLKTETVEHGSSATTPIDPARAGYTFTSWDKAFDNVTSNLTVMAVYEKSTPILSHKTAKGNLLTPTQNGINLTANANATIAVYNLSGKLISRQSYNAGNHNISFGHLSKGMYIVKASQGGGKEILRVAVR